MRLKKYLLLLIAIVTFTGMAAAQSDYKSETGPSGNKILVGKLNMRLLANDSAFSWFYVGVNKYQPNKEWTNYIKYYRDSFDVVVFAGTWNRNTQNLLPAFYRTMMASGYPLKTITLYGVDHQMHTLNGEEQKYNLQKLPTIIILDKKGNELGRIAGVPVKSMEANIVGILQKQFLPKDQEDTSDNQL